MGLCGPVVVSEGSCGSQFHPRCSITASSIWNFEAAPSQRQAFHLANKYHDNDLTVRDIMNAPEMKSRVRL